MAPAPDPVVLRGHGGDVQCATFANVGGILCVLSGDSNGDIVAWDVRSRRALWRLNAHVPSSGVLAVSVCEWGSADENKATTTTHHSDGAGSNPGRGDSGSGAASMGRVLSQGRDGTVKCWDAAPSSDGTSLDHPPAKSPRWGFSSGAYHFCRLAHSCGMIRTCRGTVRDEVVTGDDRLAADGWVGGAALSVGGEDEGGGTRGSSGLDPVESVGGDPLLAVAGSTTSSVDVYALRNPRVSDVPQGDACPTPPRICTLVAPADAAAASSLAGDVDGAPLAGGGKLGTVMALCFVPPSAPEERPLLLAGYEEGSVVLWDPSPNPSSASVEASEAAVPAVPLWRSREHGEATLCLAADVTGKGALSGGADGRVVQYAIARRRQTDRSDDDTDAAAAAAEGVTTQQVTVIRVRTHGPYVPTIPVHGGDGGGVGRQARQAGVSDVAIRVDRKICAAACWDGRVRVYEYKGKKGRVLASLAYHGDVVTSVAFSPMVEGGLLVSGSRDGTLALWPVFPPPVPVAYGEANKENGEAGTIIPWS